MNTAVDVQFEIGLIFVSVSVLLLKEMPPPPLPHDPIPTILSDRYQVVLGRGIPSAIHLRTASSPTATSTRLSISRTRGASDRDECQKEDRFKTTKPSKVLKRSLIDVSDRPIVTYIFLGMWSFLIVLILGHIR